MRLVVTVKIDNMPAIEKELAAHGFKVLERLPRFGVLIGEGNVANVESVSGVIGIREEKVYTNK